MTRNRRIRFSILPIAAFGLVFALLLWLGSWQLGRGHEKQEMYEAFAAERIDISGREVGLEDVNAARDFANIALRGRYLGEHQFLLENMTHSGRTGYHVLTPFQPAGREWIILVDRGWIGRDFEAKRLPDVSVEDETRLVEGKLSPLPRPGLVLESEGTPDGWPRITQFTTTDKLAAQLPGNRKTASPVILLAAGAPDGYERDWQPPGLKPERHFAYAFQWFALAITLLVIFLVVSLRSRRENSHGSAD